GSLLIHGPPAMSGARCPTRTPRSALAVPAPSAAASAPSASAHPTRPTLMSVPPVRRARPHRREFRVAAVEQTVPGDGGTRVTFAQNQAPRARRPARCPSAVGGAATPAL